MELTLCPGKVELATDEALVDHSLYLEEVTDWEMFLEYLPGCESCSTRRHKIAHCLRPFGSIEADVMVVLRNPHPTEMKTHQVTQLLPGGKFRPVLDGMIDVMRLSWREIYLTYAAFCSTPRNRIPHRREIENCSGWKAWELNRLKNLRFIITLGIDATKQLFGWKFPQVVKVFGNVYEVDLNGRRLFVFPCHHPRYALQNNDIREPLARWSDAVGRFIRDERKRS